MNRTFGADQMADGLLLVCRILLMLLFVIFGWEKLMGFGERSATSPRPVSRCRSSPPSSPW